MSKPRLLFLSTEQLLLPLRGGTLRTVHILKKLVEYFEVTAVLPQDKPSFQSCLLIFPNLAKVDWHFKEEFRIPKPRKLYELPQRIQSRLREVISTKRWRNMPMDWSFSSWRFWDEPIRRIITDQSPDVVIIEHTRHAESFKLVKILAPQAFLLCSSQNVESDLVGQLLIGSMDADQVTKLQAQIIRQERKMNNLCDLLWCCSSEDKQRYIEMGITKPAIRVVPNGVDTNATIYKERSTALGEPIILFIGTIGYKPNRDGIHWFYSAVWPNLKKRFPTIKWLIVGRFPTNDVFGLADIDTSIEVHADVESTQPFLDMAHVSICPLMSGSGTRLKILEAFSAGVPVVSTQLGAEGIAANNGETICIADTPQEFETAIATLINNQEYATSISRRARYLGSTKYEWSSIAESAIQDLLESIKAKAN